MKLSEFIQRLQELSTNFADDPEVVVERNLGGTNLFEPALIETQNVKQTSAKRWRSLRKNNGLQVIKVW